MARQAQIRICREGLFYSIVVLAVLIGAVCRQLNLLMLLGSALAGPLLFSFVYGRFILRRLSVERRLPSELRADQRLIVDLNVANSRRWAGAWMVEVEDTVAREGEATAVDGRASVQVFLPQVAAKEKRHSSYEGFLPRRGRYRFGPLLVSTRFPLGLVRHSVVLDKSEVLLVHPRLGELTHDWARELRENAGGSRRMQRRGLLETDFYGLRDWRAGDSRHWIHWRTSARRGTLVVRQFEQRRSEDLALLVDLWQPSEPNEHQLENVERAISFVATVIAQACRKPGHNLILSLAAHEPLHGSGPASPLFFRDQMDALAMAAPHHEASFPPALGHALALLPPSTPTLIVSTRPIDWEAVRRLAAQRDVPLAERLVQSVNVASDALDRYFHAGSPRSAVS